MYRKVNHWHASSSQLVSAQPNRAKCSHVGFEASAIQRQRNLGHLALAPAQVELASHQENGNLHSWVLREDILSLRYKHTPTPSQSRRDGQPSPRELSHHREKRAAKSQNSASAKCDRYDRIDLHDVDGTIAADLPVERAPDSRCGSSAAYFRLALVAGRGAS